MHFYQLCVLLVYKTKAWRWSGRPNRLPKINKYKVVLDGIVYTVYCSLKTQRDVLYEKRCMIVIKDKVILIKYKLSRESQLPFWKNLPSLKTVIHSPAYNVITTLTANKKIMKSTWNTFTFRNSSLLSFCLCHYCSTYNIFILEEVFNLSVGPLLYMHNSEGLSSVLNMVLILNHAFQHIA